MAKTVDREAIFTFLDGLRASGGLNMFGAAVPVSAKFGIDKRVARGFVKDWMETFATRHPNG